jgi:hypothetical protein
MFQLTESEYLYLKSQFTNIPKESLRSQIVTLSGSNSIISSTKQELKSRLDCEVLLQSKTNN